RLWCSRNTIDREIYDVSSVITRREVERLSIRRRSAAIGTAIYRPGIRVRSAAARNAAVQIDLGTFWAGGWSANDAYACRRPAAGANDDVGVVEVLDQRPESGIGRRLQMKDIHARIAERKSKMRIVGHRAFGQCKRRAAGYR